MDPEHRELISEPRYSGVKAWGGCSSGPAKQDWQTPGMEHRPVDSLLKLLCCRVDEELLKQSTRLCVLPFRDDDVVAGLPVGCVVDLDASGGEAMLGPDGLAETPSSTIQRNPLQGPSRASTVFGSTGHGSPKGAREGRVGGPGCGGIGPVRLGQHREARQGRTSSSTGEARTRLRERGSQSSTRARVTMASESSSKVFQNST